MRPAIGHYRRTLDLDPNDVEALYNGGNALLELDRPDEALASDDRTLAVKPDFAHALYNRGGAEQSRQGLERDRTAR